ncbi:MAG TPA: hypothetical protein VK929_15335, partial [Longimicrobiales bacterium]|nr:hypothetical protein [Longimicrobiales bacterium]
MGRALLTFLLAVGVAGCAPEDTDGPERTRVAADVEGARPDPHADLPCSACHTGSFVGTRIAAATRESCATSGCHEEGGPTYVSTKTATFQHRDHARDSEHSLSCSGCHTHAAGREPLQVSVDACALCHLPDIRDAEPATCKLCHQQPQHVALTSQGLPIPHS